MKRTLLFVFTLSVFYAQAQKHKATAYAITAVEKGATKWMEVRLVDLVTGEEVQTIYRSAGDAAIVNARTGKTIVRTDSNAKKAAIQKPFATHSAALAFDKKNNRLYYTPMGINQLRYIDLKAKTPRIYFFEDEPFGVVKGSGDVASQVTRMVIAPDGNGYALSNDGKHLLRFTTKKKPEITDLGALTDDLTNGSQSIHSYSAYGGDLIAGKDGNLYLITASNRLFKISISSKLASYVGRIKGLPNGFSSNGAVAEGNSKVIVCSSRSTEGYFRIDLNTLRAEKISTGSSVFNASDLANGLFAFEKNDAEETAEERVNEEPAKTITTALPVLTRNKISVYPNPATSGFFKISFADQQPGRYNVQLLDMAGKVISTKPYNLLNKVQVEEFRLPKQLAAGNYMVRIVNEAANTSSVQQLAVQQ